MTFALSAIPRLIGRAAELETLFGVVDRAPERGRALVVRGEPGIGKTSLLKAASRHATDSGVRVLSAVGVQSEADLAFSGLHQLVLPLLAGTGWRRPGPGALDGVPPVSDSTFHGLGRLPVRQRDALATALLGSATTQLVAHGFWALLAAASNPSAPRRVGFGASGSRV